MNHKHDLEDSAVIITPVLILASGFTHFSLYHGFSIISSGVLLGLCVLMIVGLVFGVVLVAIPSKVIRATMLSYLLMAFCELQFGLADQFEELYTVTDSPILRLGVISACIVLVVVIAVLLNEHIAKILAVVFSVILLGTILLPPGRPSYGLQTLEIRADQSDLPPVVHIVFDGHIGIEGIPKDIPGGEVLSNDIREFYLNHGFRVFGRTYSKHFITPLSLSQLLNWGEGQFHLEQPKKGRWFLNQNDYFEHQVGKGYQIRVYELDYLSYCRARVESCFNYRTSSPLVIEEHNISPTDKAFILLSSFLQNSLLHRPLALAFDRVFGKRDRMEITVSTLGVMDVFDQLIADIESYPRGRVFFSHALLPHGPYVFNKDCSVRTDPDMWLDRRSDHEFNTVSSTDHRKRAYRLYFSQVRCTMKVLERVFEALKENGLWDDATIIVHGDHGSKITLRDPVIENIPELTSRDLIDGYSTLYAIRSPEIPAGYDKTVISIQTLFESHILEKEIKTDDGLVYTIPGRKRRSIPIEMPVLNY